MWHFIILNPRLQEAVIANNVNVIFIMITLVQAAYDKRCIELSLNNKCI